MADIEELVEKFRAKLIQAQEADKFKNETVMPLVNKVFNDYFALIFETLINVINSEVGSRVISFIPEGKNRFVIEGQNHRIIFQKGKSEIIEGIIRSSIIPIYVWKGVTKHLGLITFYVNPQTNEVKWDIASGNVENYAKNLFDKLIDDEDFSM